MSGEKPEVAVALDGGGGTPVEVELPGLTTERLRELVRELSLLDACRLVLVIAAGPRGLSSQGAAVMEVETAVVKLKVQRIRQRPVKKKAVKRS